MVRNFQNYSTSSNLRLHGHRDKQLYLHIPTNQQANRQIQLGPVTSNGSTGNSQTVHIHGSVHHLEQK